jgi:hypothetical protein
MLTGLVEKVRARYLFRPSGRSSRASEINFMTAMYHRFAMGAARNKFEVSFVEAALIGLFR